jgi:predicted LPLAT superfamily acyltransferase
MSEQLPIENQGALESFRPCIVVPFYNHGRYIGKVLSSLVTFATPIIITNDGSDEANSTLLLDAVSGLGEQSRFVHLLAHDVNNGKGTAVLTALNFAREQSFTHALQVDADGQHTISDIPKLFSAAQNQPEHLILTHPIFGADAPLERIWGRKVCNWLVRLQTLSLTVKDAMIGFRVYPVLPVVDEHQQKPFRARMGFDIEVIVRLMRRGLMVSSLPSAVRYHSNGISHFKYGRDNVEIGLLHTELAFSGVTGFFKNKLVGTTLLNSKAAAPNWFEKKERGSSKGIGILFFIATTCGRRALEMLLWPVALYFLLADKQARTASASYLRRIRSFDTNKQHSGLTSKTSLYLQSLKHIHSFASATANGVLQWHVLTSKKPQTTPSLTEFRKHLLAGSGGIILSAHFGALESARAQVSNIDTVSIKPLMYHGNSPMYRNFLATVNPKSAEGLFFSDTFSVAELAACQSFIEGGGYLAILADRPAPTNQERTLEVSFLGETVHLPLGPFLLCHLLRVPVTALFCVFAKDGSFSFEFRPLFDGEPPRDRNQFLSELSTRYAAEMQAACLKNPLQWLNFYDYFNDSTQKSKVVSDATRMPSHIGKAINGAAHD